MICFIILFLCSVSFVVADFEKDLNAFLKEPNLLNMKYIEQGVLDGACMSHEFTTQRDLYEKICFARVWIPIFKKQWFDAYRILWDVKNDFSQNELKLDWSGLDKTIKENLSLEQICKVESEFRYFMEHGEYPDSDTDESSQGSPEILSSDSESDSDLDSVRSDDNTSLPDKSLDHSNLPHVRPILSVEHF